jgi:hypothetical protein
LSSTGAMAGAKKWPTAFNAPIATATRIKNRI